MKRLILMRHCKSDWATGVPDIERPLNKRGTHNAEALAEWLRQNDLIPDEVLCSAATRTQQTAQGLGVAPTLMRALYLAEAGQMAQMLRAASGDVVLMIGHNPGIAHLAAELAESWPSHPDFPRYPTGATLVVDFDIDDWQALEMESGTVMHFTVPRDL